MSTEEVERAQALAGLRVLGYLVRVDGRVSDEERAALRPSFEALDLSVPEIEALLAEEVELEAALAAVVDPSVQRAVVRAAYGVARSDGATAEELAVIDAARAAWDLEVERPGLARELLEQAEEDLAPHDVTAVEDPAERGRAVERLVRSRAIGLAVLALPPPNLITETIGGVVQFQMVRAIGRLHGHAGDSQMTKALVGSLLGVITLHAGLGALVRLVPVWGSAVGAAGAFATTYGIGYAANAYFDADGDLDERALKEAFKTFRVAGEESYDADAVEQKWRGRRTDISELSRRFLRGEIGAQEVSFKFREDLGEA